MKKFMFVLGAALSLVLGRAEAASVKLKISCEITANNHEFDQSKTAGMFEESAAILLGNCKATYRGPGRNQSQKYPLSESTFPGKDGSPGYSHLRFQKKDQTHAIMQVERVAPLNDDSVGSDVRLSYMAEVEFVDGNWESMTSGGYAELVVTADGEKYVTEAFNQSMERAIHQKVRSGEIELVGNGAEVHVEFTPSDATRMKVLNHHIQFKGAEGSFSIEISAHD